ncbi:uncharacterized protein fndc7rs1 isoform X3 [Brienomyrus brachyistius]|uniref:uncharacterized protein fndc7rs1 isoform X3 n=1 Tax=Brienomyrus brachyistius TaxID=42636 RepID=UPI0020B38CDF|nr:uncharacterized protein fndc7rs1 isoform X3 [Brienomyrus brachyistius]
MEFLGIFFLILISLIQIQYIQAQDCSIISITSPSATSLKVKWKRYSSATSYFLDLRTTGAISAPVVVTVAPTNTERLVQGLRPGTVYTVSLKAFYFYNVVCSSSPQTALTVPPPCEVTSCKSITSTAVTCSWTPASSAKFYYLMLENAASRISLNNSFTGQSGVVDNLHPSTPYNCSVYAVNDGGLGARSTVKAVTTLTQPPTGITVQSINPSTTRVSWQRVNKVLTYRVTVWDSDNASVTLMVLNATSNVVDINNLPPCATFTIGVSSINEFLEPGEPANTTFRRTDMLPVTSISVDYRCASRTVLVTWLLVSGAKSYRASITSPGNLPLNCTSQMGSCEISELACGKMYTAFVTAVSGICERTSQTSTSFETVPCPPVDMMLFRECSSNTITFSWSATNNTVHYVATSVDSTGFVTECITTDTSCFFTTTICSETYEFTVYSYTGQCNSELSMPVYIQAAPCEPTNLKAVADCNSNTLIALWDDAPGALFYTVEAVGNFGDYYICNSSTTSCPLADVLCGQSLSVWITASDYDCTTNRVLGDTAETMPCLPQNISSENDCRSDSVMLKWDYSAGAVSYTALATHADGTVSSCNSVGTGCRVQGLRCGETYFVSLLVTNLICNITENLHTTVETAPCPPYQVNASLDCSGNRALISWWNTQKTGSHTATIKDQYAGQFNCSSTTDGCIIPDLRCGQTYTVNVAYYNGRCQSLPSGTVQMNSVPCAPTNVTAVRNCQQSSVMVSWAASQGARNYTVTALSNSGHSVGSLTNNTTCNITGLRCSQIYAVGVMAVGDNCSSLSSQTVTVATAPCSPTNLGGSIDCSSNTASITWNMSTNSLMYSVQAVGRAGDRVSCNNTAPSCQLSGLLCGQNYNFTVSASDTSCQSPNSTPFTLKTGPCTPSNIQNRLDCGSNNLTVSWDPNPDPLNYSVSVRSADGTVQFCSSWNTSCIIGSLICGQNYTFNVTASSNDCRSPPSMTQTIRTVPCVPQLVQGNTDCASNALLVSWISSRGARTYAANILGPNGYSNSCTTANLSCSFSQLQCSQQYNISVLALDSQCNSTSSPAISVSTVPCTQMNVATNLSCNASTAIVSWDASLAPCPPVIVNSTVNCTTNVASVSWVRGNAVVNVVVNASSSQGHQTWCRSGSGTCDLVDLRCGQNYTVRASVAGASCDNAASPASYILTVPCAPTNVTAVRNCQQSSVMVSWAASQGARNYTVTALSNSGHSVGSLTNNTTCNITGLRCSQIYAVGVMAVGDSCSSLSSQTVTVATAPCSPTNLGGSIGCSSNTASITWNMSTNSLMYSVQAVGRAGDRVSCNNTAPSCQLNGLLCGQNYSFTVSASDTSCQSPNSTPFTLKTGPCTPSNVWNRLDCGNNTLTVSWDPNPDPLNYSVSVRSADGIVQFCSSWNTSCTIGSLTCGLNYTFNVTASSNNCSSPPSVTQTIRTVPCVPQLVQGNVDCASNALLVSWISTRGARTYAANILGPNGYSNSCTTANLSCSFSQLQCSQQYNISVLVLDSQCNSTSSPAISVSTAPCPPVIVNSTVNCTTNVASVSWVRGNAVVNVVVNASSSQGHQTWCRSGSGTCDLVDLRCGQNYTVRASVAGASCDNAASPASYILTVPCAPTNVTAVRNCQQSSVMVSWAASQGARNYTVTALSNSGHSVGSLSNNTTCNVTGLRCSQIYAVGVMAVGDSCSSLSSQTVTVATAPCSPTNLGGSIDCSSNTASITWNMSTNSLMYSVQAVGRAGDRVSCNNTAPSCQLNGLLCGQNYSFTVSASDTSCQSPNSTPFTLKTGPCTPSNVWNRLDCGNNTLTVSWDPNPDPLNYSVSVRSADGIVQFCSSWNTSCTIGSLTCGLNYTFNVTASSNNCSSPPSVTQTIRTVPCVPQLVQGNVDCASNALLVSWISTRGARTYAANILGPNGYSNSCTTANLSCSFSQLQCSQQYNISVLALDSQCNSTSSPAISVSTAPCPPVIVNSTVNCTTNVASVSWVRGNAVVNVVVNASSSQGHQIWCRSGSGTCNLVDLRCGQNYTVRASVAGASCDNAASPASYILTVPCAPTNVTAVRNCQQSSVMVSWAASQGARNYTVTALSNSGHSVGSLTNNTTCNITGLRCSQIYAVGVMAVGDSCSSLSSQTVTVATAPCSPTNLGGSIDCSSNTASITWNMSTNSLMYSVQAVGRAGDRVSCNNTAPSCQLSGLLCGQNYSFTVSASDTSCQSPNSTPFTLKTGPCIPSNVQNRLDCGSNNLTVSWDPNPDPLNYSVSVRSADGTVQFCSNWTTSCTIGSLICGQNYTFNVTASSNDCRSPPSVTQTIRTVPCVPQPVQGNVDCASNALLVSWISTRGARTYAANILGPNGYSNSCTTANLSCSFSQLQCSQQYNISVLALDSQCNSTSSPAISVSTVPCSPANVATNLSCNTSTAMVSWDASLGARRYTVLALASRTFLCFTNSTICQLNGLQCGQTYNITVLADDGNCNSTLRTSATMTAVPCAPTNVTAVRNCQQSSVMVSWAASQGARNYTVTALSNSGHSVGSLSNNTTCNITGLRCSQIYAVGVMAVGDSCSSLSSQTVTVATAPCSPTNLGGSIDCSSNTASITWNMSTNSLMYSVQAVGRAGDRVSCNNTAPSCQLSGLLCGQNYSFTVSASDTSCQSPNSTPFTLKTGPCTPSNIWNRLDCGNNTLTVSWDPNPDPLNYSVSVRSADGTVQFCSSWNTSCTIGSLTCGLNYTFNVTASSNNCRSPPSVTQTIRTVPCVPQPVQGNVDCASNALLVSWISTRGARTYAANILGPNGYSNSCTTANLSCSFSQLQCSQQYNISVLALDSQCNSTSSPAISVSTVPCSPANVATNLSCNTSTAMVSWDASLGARRYTVLALASRTFQCFTNSTTCQLNGLQCGQTYNITVLADDGNCNSTLRTSATMTAVPCAPTNVTAVRNCQQSSVMVSWAASQGARNYTVTALSNSGHSVGSLTNNTTCNITGLRCSQIYTVRVMAVGDSCSSLSSQTVTVATAPCSPARVRPSIDCLSNTVSLTWDVSPNSLSYNALAIGRAGDRVSCNNTAPSCQLCGLLCGQNYNFTVSASDSSCQSPNSTPVTQPTAPCSPTNIQNRLDCGTNSLTVSWDGNLDPLNYNVGVRSADGIVQTCVSISTSCSVTSLSCGQDYGITVTASNNYCRSPPSVTRTIRTVPCVPQLVRGNIICALNTLLVSWDSTRGAQAYAARILGSNGYSNLCTTADVSCSFSQLQCSQQYNISVLALDSQCNSTSSPAISVSTVPCSPANVATNLSCNSSTAVVSWDASLGARRYTVLAAASRSFQCFTSSTTCQLNGLQCGQTYNITVLADDGNCNSTLRTSATMTTAPCPPVIVNSTVNCTTNVASVSWVRGNTVVNVVVNASSSQGHQTWCRSSSGTCDLVDLRCGQNYTVRASVAGASCDNAASPASYILTVPCAPTNVTAVRNCQQSSVMVSWAASQGARNYTVTALSNSGHSVGSLSNNTTCNITGLRCSQIYAVGVMAVGDSCSSLSSQTVTVATAPCSPTNLGGSIDCLSNTALITWNISTNSLMYNVQAVGRAGDRVSSNNTAPSCQLSGLLCGQNYNFTVSASDTSCQSPNSIPFTLKTGPCTPSNIQNRLDCGSNNLTVSWDPNPDPLNYSVSIRSADGTVQFCSSWNTNCTIGSLTCGLNYTFNVTASSNNCRSPPSMTQTIRTVLCVPQLVQGNADCASNALLVSWNSTRGARTYAANILGPNGYSNSCTTANLSCSFSQLQCSQQYNISVLALDSQCNSTSSPPISVSTVPCSPVNVATNLSCNTSTAMVSWDASQGARHYTVLATASRSFQCFTSSTTCQLNGLQCGQTYNITVLADDGNCNSTLRTSATMTTAPCPPVIANSTMNCTNNVASLSWAMGNGVVDVVIQASSSQGYQTWCRSRSSTCSLVDLRCGQNYTVQATATGVRCVSLPSPAFYIVTAPCAPQNVTGNLDCMSNSAWVTWGQASGAQTYVVTALGSSGDNGTCSTSNTNCTVPSLRCGALYTFYVTGSNLQCRSPASSTFNIQTAPCQPTRISADLSCANSTAYVTWAPVTAAVQYLACAQSTGSNQLCCQTTNTFCTVVGLQCGSTYNFSVQASNQVCRSSFSQPYTKGAVPCPPSAVGTRLYPMQNGIQVLKVSWGVTVCRGVEYLAETSSSNQDNEDTHFVMSSYWTDGTVFEFPMLCNSRYTVTVQSRNLAGPSTLSTAVNGKTAPCAPMGCTYSINNGSAILSWNASVLATEYAVYELKGAELMLLCRTVQLQCNVTGANRSAIRVMAINDAGQSNPSTNIQDITRYRTRRELKRTNPFYEEETDLSIPVLKIGNVTSNSLYAEWNSVEGATSYSLVVRQQSSEQPFVELSVCGFNSTVTDLKPATTYCVSVSAKTSTSTSPYSTPICVKTGVQI